MNVFAFKDGEEVRLGPVPGLVPFATLDVGPRGSLLVGSVVYTATKDKLWKTTNAGASGLIGALQGTKLVTMARNNRSPAPDVAIVADGNAFVSDGLTVTDYPDTDVGSPNSVAFQGGYFAFSYGNGVIRASDLNTTAINDQSFTVAESNPDGLLRVIAKGRQLIALGPSSTEFYDNVGTAPFPFALAEVVPTGLFGPWAVTGFEDGWDKQWFMVASDGTVGRWDGYTFTRISTRDVERSIATVTNAEDLTAHVYTFGGNAVVSLNGPGFTWEYHLTSGAWFERESYGLKRGRAQTSVKAFGRWLVGDTQSASLMAVAEGSRREGSNPVVCEGEGYLKTFEVGARLNDLRLNFTTGQGVASGLDPIETKPRVMIDYSLNGGGKYSQPLERSLGEQGEFARVVSVTSLGRAKDKGVKVRFRISDPVQFAMAGMTIGRVVVRRA